MHLKKIRKAIFPVGGLGTRFLPATKSIPKEMLPVASKPLIQHAFEEAQAAGIEQFIFITGRNKNAIINHFDHSYELQNLLTNQDKKLELDLAKSWLPEAGKVVFIRQQVAKGLGHAILCAKDIVGDEPFAVLLADEMMQCEQGFLNQMQLQYDQFGENIVAVAAVDKSKTKSYGIIEKGPKNGDLLEIRNMVEKPDPIDAPSNLSITGRYILQPSIFEYLEKAQPGVGGEIQLTDSMQKMIEDGNKFYGLEFTGPRFDCGNQLGFLEANIAYALANSEISAKVTDMLAKYKKS